MKDTNIILNWFENGKRTEKEINRESVMAVFEGLKEGFDGNNEISRKLLDVLPNVDEITINKDYIETQDVPSIAYSIDGSHELLKIMRCHKIVWAILDKHCS